MKTVISINRTELNRTTDQTDIQLELLKPYDNSNHINKFIFIQLYSPKTELILFM